MNKKKVIKIIVSAIIIVLIISIIVLFLIFKNNKINCKSVLKSDDYTIKTYYTLYQKNKKVNKIVLTKKIETKNNTILDYYLTTYENDSITSQKKYGGFNIKKDKNKIKVVIDYKKVKMKELIKDNEYISDYVSDKSIDIKGIYKLFDINEKMCN